MKRPEIKIRKIGNILTVEYFTVKGGVKRSQGRVEVDESNPTVAQNDIATLLDTVRNVAKEQEI